VDELVRFRRTPTGLEPGPGPGRGAWLCRDDPAKCLDEAQRRRAVGRALRSTVEDDDIRRLRAKLMPEK
jgi:translation initiation factor IF-2